MQKSYASCILAPAPRHVLLTYHETGLWLHLGSRRQKRIPHFSMKSSFLSFLISIVSPSENTREGCISMKDGEALLKAIKCYKNGSYSLVSCILKKKRKYIIS